MTAYYANDGAAAPYYSPLKSIVYVASTNTTWIFWEGWETVGGTLKRVVECATYNGSTQVWSGNYLVGTNTLTNDSHGAPSAVQDAAGRLWVFYGAHSSSLRIAVSTNPNDPTAWTTVSSLVGAYTFPIPHLIGSKIYLFFSTNGSHGQPQEVWSLQIGTPSGTTISWGSEQDMFDFGAVSPLPGTMINKGDGTIPFTLITTNFSSSYNQDVFYAYYDTATGNVCNFGGALCIVPASQPISLATGQASYRVVDQTDVSHYGSQPGMMLDAAGATHIAYTDSAAVSGSPLTFEHIVNSGSGWSAPHAVGTTGNCTADYGQVMPVPNAAGGIDDYWNDSALGDCGGNLWRTTRASNGTWGSAVEVQAAASFPLRAYGVPVPDPGGSGYTGPRFLFSENVLDLTTTSGILKGYLIVSNNGIVQRQLPWGQVGAPW